MAPPVYADLGKAANDLFKEGYPFKIMRLENKLTYSGFQLGTKLVSNWSNLSNFGIIVGKVKALYAIGDVLGLALDWKSGNTFSIGIAIKDKSARFLKL